MGIFDRLFKKPAPAPEPVVQTLEVVPENPQQYIYPVLNEFRKGMWVKTSGYRIGILAQFLDRGLVAVMLTDAAGNNVQVEEHPLNSLVRAKSSEIPYPRIEHLSLNELRALGYED